MGTNRLGLGWRGKIRGEVLFGMGIKGGFERITCVEFSEGVTILLGKGLILDNSGE